MIYYQVNYLISTVAMIAVPPDIVYGDETSKDLSVSEGENVTLNCQATGTPKPRVSWRREDGQHILIRNSTSFSSSYSSYLLSVYYIHRAYTLFPTPFILQISIYYSSGCTKFLHQLSPSPNPNPNQK